MTKLLIDIDVILDFFFQREPFADSSAQILSLCESKKIKGYITPVIVSNVYYLLRQTAKHEKVIEKLKLLLSITEILAIDKAIVLHALSSEFRDFEDAIQNYTAELNNEIAILITRNIKDYKHSHLAIMTPDNFLQMRNTDN